jgi:topoisomerase IA-like protein
MVTHPQMGDQVPVRGGRYGAHIEAAEIQRNPIRFSMLQCETYAFS